MTDQDRPPPIELPLERYLEFFSAKSDRLMEAVRFEFYLCLVFASVFATSLIAVLTGASPSLLWILAMVLGIAGAVWFYFMAYFYYWSAYQFLLNCWGIVVGWFA